MKAADYAIMGSIAFLLLFLGVLLLPGDPTQASLNAGYDEGCRQLVSLGCDHDSVKSIDGLTSGSAVYTLGNLCAQRGFADSVACANSCGCNSTGEGSDLIDTPLRAYSSRPVKEGVIITDEPEFEFYYGE